MMVYRWVQLQRSDEPASTPAPTRNQERKPLKSMSARSLAWLFLYVPERLEKPERETLAHLLEAEPINTASTLTQHLVTMVKERNA